LKEGQEETRAICNKENGIIKAALQVERCKQTAWGSCGILLNKRFTKTGWPIIASVCSAILEPGLL